MYKCEVCKANVGPGLPLLRHQVTRVLRATKTVTVGIRHTGSPIHEQEDFMREEIAREVMVCKDCHLSLSRGVPLKELIRHRKIEAGEIAPPAKPVAMKTVRI